MSTVMVDQELFQRACEAAAAQGKTVEDFVDAMLRQALALTSPQQTMRNGVPVMLVSLETPAIDPAHVRRWLEEEGF
jgi:hypothetical protein